MAKKITKEIVQQIPFLHGGIMFYFTDDKKFLYFRKQYKSSTNEDIKLARKSSTPIQLSPLELLCAILRESLTEQNIGNFCKEPIVRYNMTSEEFLSKHFTPHYSKRFTKYQGTIKGEDFWVKEYRHFPATPQNLSVFQM